MRTWMKILPLILLLSILIFFFWPEKPYKPYHVDSDYRSQVDAYYLPPMPPDWEWKSFITQDGTHLRWGETGNGQAARATLIWIPGYTATLDMYGEHFDSWARQGFHNVGLDLRGQGGSQRHRESQPEKLWVEDFSVYSNDLAEFVQSLKLSNERPVILVGMSFGGHVVLRAVGDHKLDVDGLYLLAPAIQPLPGEETIEDLLRYLNIGRKLGKSQHYVRGESNWKPDKAYNDFSVASVELCSTEPKRLYHRDVIFTREPDQRVGGVTYHWAAEFLESSQFILKNGYLEEIALPITIISASFDTFVRNDTITKTCSTRFPNCVEFQIPNTGHCLLQERDEVITEIYKLSEKLFERLNLDEDKLTQ